jgi:hypothetical protein
MGLKVYSSESRVQILGFRVWVHDLGFDAHGSEVRVWNYYSCSYDIATRVNLVMFCKVRTLPVSLILYYDCSSQGSDNRKIVNRKIRKS